MDMTLPGADERLHQRYQLLVQDHTGHAHPGAAGPRPLPRAASIKAAAQAAWRFYRNPRTTPTRLVHPLLQAARQAIPTACHDYALVPLDWSHLDYRHHVDKHDRIQIGQKEEIGYELLSALVLDDDDGRPLAPLCLRLQAAAGVYSTHSDKPQPPQSQLDELAPVMDHVHTLALGKPPVFIIDAEADSVYHLRQWAQAGHLFLVRCDGQRFVRSQGQEWELPALTETLRQQGAFHDARQVNYEGRPVCQYVAEVAVVLDRPARLEREVNGQRKRLTVPGAPLAIRLIISELRAADGTVLERWLLLTNLPAAVDAATVVLWYYWRWRIETFFKLLKSAGQQVERWQQENGAAILKRLLVASMACVLVWRLARSAAPQAPAARGLLMQLSGRQRQWGKEFTHEGLLAGLWVLLAMVEVLEQRSPDQLCALANFILNGSVDPETG
jgi:Transposase DDE domain